MSRSQSQSEKTRIVGRIEERRSLDDAMESPDAELLAVYGRRRVGKTFLVREHFGERIAFEIAGLHGESTVRQLAHFFTSLRNAFPKAIVTPPSTWLEAFGMLETIIERGPRASEKRVLFFDEFPWLATRKSGFLSAFESFWNGFASRRRDLVVVLCGSAAAWMIRKIIQARGGLHNRVTRRIRLLPFDLSETRAYLEHRQIRFDDMQLSKIYMSVGGIPHYLNLIKKGKSAAQSIDQLFFRGEAMLRDEYSQLYAALFEEYATHESIVRALASSWQGLARDELLAKAKLKSGGGITKAIEELSQSGFITATASRGRVAKDTIYRLSDEYSLFYWHWIARTVAGESWQSKATSSRYKTWCGYAFGSLCFKHIQAIKRSLEIGAVETTVSSWRFMAKRKGEEGAQIDLLIDRADRCTNLCEIKFSEEPFVITKAYAAELERKVRVFSQRTKTRNTIFLTMITANGLKPNQYTSQLISSSITLRDLIR